MYRAILFDLDGTLIENDMKKFIAAYFESLGPRIKDHCKNGNFQEAIYASTRPIFKNFRSPVPLIELFYQEMTVYTGLNRQELEDLFLEYYQDEYQKIKVVKPVSGVRECLQLATDKVEKLVVATVPIFPITAIETRLEQGGLADFSFDLITGIDVMHCSKPHRYYFEEILQKIDCNPEECLMVGNDHVDDMAAKAIGIETFLLKRFQLNKGKSRYTPDHTGSINDLTKFLEKLA